ncbi:MAG: hypothetical protein HY921_02415 [Elusimicrobia bacterium]|nr:hypothetical protein [Elusimicrobiota bacterium]
MPPAGQFLVYGYPLLLAALFLSWLLLAFLQFGVEFGNCHRIELACLGGIFVAALSLRLLWPHRPQVYFDEFEHADIAANLARRGAFAESWAGGSPELSVLKTPTWPGGFHFLLSLIFRAFGPSWAAAAGLNALLASASILLIFWAALLAWDDWPAAATAAGLLAFSPLHLRFSTCGDLTASSLFWILSALGAFFLALREKSLKRYLLLLTSLAIAAHTRPENLLLFPVLLGSLHLRGQAPGGKPARAAETIFIASSLPILLIAFVNHSQGLPGYGESFSSTFGHLARNIPRNLLYFLRQPGFSLMVIPAAIYGAASPKAKGGQAPLLALALGYGLLYSGFFRGNFNLGAECRYALAPMIFIYIFAGLGLSAASKRMGLAALPALGIAFTSFLSASQYRWQKESAFDQEYRFMLESSASLPSGAWIIAYSPPAVLSVMRMASISPYLILEQPETWLKHLEGKEAVLFKDCWWHERARDSAPVEAILRQAYDLQPLRTAHIGSKDFSFELLIPKRLK